MIDIAAVALLMVVGLLLAMAPLVLLALLHARGMITREEAEQAVRDMADGQVRLCGH